MICASVISLLSHSAILTVRWHTLSLSSHLCIMTSSYNTAVRHVYKTRTVSLVCGLPLKCLFLFSSPLMMMVVVVAVAVVCVCVCTCVFMCVALPHREPTARSEPAAEWFCQPVKPLWITVKWAPGVAPTSAQLCPVTVKIWYSSYWASS